MEELLKIENLSVDIHSPAGIVRAVRDVSFELYPGEVLAIVGESGCGKSMLCKSIMKLRPKSAKIQGGRIIANGVKPGIVVKPKTPAEAVLPYLHKCDLVLVMTVEPGFGGQKFMADMMPKLKTLKEMIDTHKPGCHLEVDGGVDMVTAEICKDNGADVLVAGSAFYKAEDKPAFVQSLER